MLDIALSSVLIAVAIILSTVLQMGLRKSLLIGMVRSFVQLIAVGYIIHFIFQLEGIVYQILLLVAMSVVASFTAHRQVGGIRGVFIITWVSIIAGSILTLGFLIAFGVIDTTPRYFIPFGGMIIGNTMNSIIIALERLISQTRDRRHIVESALSLGASPRRAIHHLLKSAVRASLIPRINMLKIAGIIQLPGAFMGMLIAGASPIEAAKLQIIVMYMIVGCVSISIMVLSFLMPRFLFNKNEQLVFTEEKDILKL